MISESVKDASVWDTPPLLKGHDHDMDAFLRVRYGISAVQAHNLVQIKNRGDALFALALDGVLPDPLRRLRALCQRETPLSLVLTQYRAEKIGAPSQSPCVLYKIKKTDTDAFLADLAYAAHPQSAKEMVFRTKDRFFLPPSSLSEMLACGVTLTKMASCLPALLIVGGDQLESCTARGCPSVEVADINSYHAKKLETVRLISSADVPLEGGIATRLHVFRDITGQETGLLLIGAPDPGSPVPLRIHSSCLTGDIFGSRRCDCGAQLRQSIASIDQMGGGAILYLNQEGRGVGLANKMRAYNLQDHGFDTMDANTCLGFAPDERCYDLANVLVNSMGWHKLILLTNNPAKIAAMPFESVERRCILTQIHTHNRSYLEAKARKAGHHIDNIIMNYEM